MKEKEINYKVFFFVGLTFVGSGVALMAAVGTAGIGLLGIVFMIIGLVNRDKWSNND